MPKKIVVDLTKQNVTAYDSHKVFHVCECVSGDTYHPTPVGIFRIIRKQHPYWSHTYHVQMNYAMFFKNTGEALHQYHGPAPWWLLRAGREMTDLVGSHGCVRLQERDARVLYDWASLGMTVEISS